MKYSRQEMRRILLRLRAEMLLYLGRTEQDIFFCGRCLLPLPEGEYERYRFCPWCSKSPDGYPPNAVLKNVQAFTWAEIHQFGAESEQTLRLPCKSVQRFDTKAEEAIRELAELTTRFPYY